MLTDLTKYFITVFILILNSHSYSQTWEVKDTLIEDGQYYIYPKQKKRCCSESIDRWLVNDTFRRHIPKDGKWIQFYLEDNKRVAKKFNIKDSILNGLCTVYYWNQRIERTGDYIDGRKSGKWTEFDEQGNMTDQSFYLRGSANGESWTFYKNGKIESNGFFINNSRDSIWTFYHENGELKYQLHYEDGDILDDTFHLYFDNNNLMIVGALKDGLQNGEWCYFHPNTNLKAKGGFTITNMNICAGGIPWESSYSLKAGDWSYYYETGEKLAEIEYKIIRGLSSRKSSILDRWIDKSKVKRATYYNRKGKRVSKNYILKKELIDLDDINNEVQQKL